MQIPQTLNITVGTDVILHVTLTHDGENINPELIEDLSVALVSGLAKHTSLETTTEAGYIVANIPWVEGRLPGCYSLELKGTINGLLWSSVGKSIIRYTPSTQPGHSSVIVHGDTYDVTMDVGYYYTDSPIEQVKVTVDENVGTPRAEVTYDKRKLNLDFHNLKGNGIASIEQTVTSTEDSGVNVVTITDDLGNEENVEIRNGGTGPTGPEGPKGDSIIVGQGDLPLSNVVDDSDDKAVTPKAVADELFILHEEDKSDATLTDGYIQTGGTYTSSGNKTAATGYIDCDGAEKIEISMIVLTTSPSQYLAFYSTDSASGYMSQIARIRGDAEGTEIHTYDVPQGAKYFRSTYWDATRAETYGDFHCILKYPTISRLDKLEEDAESLSADVDSMTGDVEECKDELFEEARKPGTDTETIEISSWANNTSISALTGKTKTSLSTKCTGYIDVSSYYSLNYSKLRLSTVRTTHTGMAFYDENYEYLSGEEGDYSKTKGVEPATVVVPENAKYARFTAWKDEQYGEFSLEGTNAVTETVARYARDIELLNRKIDSFEGKSQIMELDQMDIVERNVIGSDGDYTSNSNMGCTDYIPCYGAAAIKYTRVVSSLLGAGLAFYDDDKVFIEGSYVDSETGDNGMAVHVVEVPQGASYFRASGWNYENSKLYGEFQASFESSLACCDGKRASNGESTYFSVVYNAAIDNLAADDFDSPSQEENYVCTTAVVLLPDDYTMDGKPSRVIINFHGWSHYVHYKKWGTSTGFTNQKERWAAAGYAVIDVNHKDSACPSNGLTGYSGLGSRQDDECYRRAFEWVKEHYNVEDTCFVVCGSAGGMNGINACYNWPEVRCGVWLDAWVDVAAHAHPNDCGRYFYGYSGSYDASKVGTRNPATRIINIGGVDYLPMPPCPIKIYHLTPPYDGVFVDIIKAGHAIGGDYIVRTCTGISHPDLVSGGDGTNEKSKVVDREIINYLNQH